MSPQNRMRRSLPLALCAGVTLAMSSVAFASGQTVPFVLKVYADAPGGPDLLSGHYPTALKQLREHGPDALDPAAVNANSCVAYALTRNWQQARTACDAAVRTANAPNFQTALWAVSGGGSPDRRLAAAYSDRAVMRWLASDRAGARADLAKAMAISPAAGFVTRNEAAVEFHTAEVHKRGN
jgi:hypothetical protein